jgi:hypothetical protein
MCISWQLAVGSRQSAVGSRQSAMSSQQPAIGISSPLAFFDLDYLLIDPASFFVVK